VLPLEVEDLVVEYDGVRAINGIDIRVRAGHAVGLVGRNGAGKSTTMRVVAGVVPPTSGAVRVGGVDATRDPIAARTQVGYCPDVGGLIPRATPWEHLQLAAALRGLRSGWESRARDLLERFDLADAADRVAAGFSHGMGRRMSVVLAVFHEPGVLLLDEPFDGVDPTGVDATMHEIREAQMRGSAVLVSTHLLDLAAESTEEILVLRGGSVVAGSPARQLAGPTGAARYKTLLR
jgi:ABC-2 type transport system ATP-binding protein